jgi:hypothetical protein
MFINDFYLSSLNKQVTNLNIDATTLEHLFSLTTPPTPTLTDKMLNVKRVFRVYLQCLIQNISRSDKYQPIRRKLCAKPHAGLRAK